MSPLTLTAAFLVLTLVASPTLSEDTGKLPEALALFTKHKCTESIKCATDITTKEPDCKTLKKAGICMFEKCPAIKKTDDAMKAAKLLVEFANEDFKCDFKTDDILPNGASGISGSLSVLLVAALVKIFFV